MLDALEVLDGQKQWAVVCADCIEAMQVLSDDSIDAIVCDPPYGLEFMGKDWDRLDSEFSTGAGKKSQPGIGARQTEWPSNRGWNEWRCANCNHLFHGGSPCSCSSPRPIRQDDRWSRMQEWHFRWVLEALRILKPGGHLIAFGGSRTYHRLACAVEDAGFEIRNMLSWIYATGFPKNKSMREIGRPELGTALKPAHEPVVLARKPLSESTVAANVLKLGTGALNIDGCRVGLEGMEKHNTPSRSGLGKRGIYGASSREQGANSPTRYDASGRWPADILLDEEAAKLLDQQIAPSRSRKGKPRKSKEPGAGWGMTATGAEYEDSGGPSRFFFVAKAGRKEREAGLDTLPERKFAQGNEAQRAIREDDPDYVPGKGGMNMVKHARNHHPTVKPIALMRYLCRLITPPGGIVLDPFVGSGTTGIAVVLEGFRFIGIEKEAEYVEIAEARIQHWASTVDRKHETS